ncbi:MAG TPA: hypothetical protein VNA12_05390 [Mycobacteriales bacterium]|nr:hypothetical protein [Mycobacteriales bacterium]
MTPVVLLLLGALGAGLLAWFQHRRAEQRRAALAAFAAANGWSFEPGDSEGIGGWWSDPPFGIGHSRRVTNVLRGVVDDRPMRTFDYRYKITTSNGKTSTTRTYHFGVTALRLPAHLPNLEVGPENVLTRLGNALGLDDVELESEDFNRSFRVRGSARFAHDVLTPRTMEQLLRGCCTGWRVSGSDLIGWDEGRSDEVEILARIDTLRRVADGIPAFVWRDHGYDPPRGIGSAGG